VRSVAGAAEQDVVEGTPTRPAETEGLSRGASAASTSASPESELLEDGEIPPEVAHLFGTLRDEAVRRLDEFQPIHLFSLCWAYSTARLMDEELQKQIVGAALRLGEKRDSQPRREDRGRKAKAEESTADSPADSPPADSPPVDSPADSPANSPEATESALPGDPGQENPGQENTMRHLPCVLAETDHWAALYKPPFWQVSVDSKEAAKAAAVGPFEEEEEGDADDDGPEAERRRPRMQMWIKQNPSLQHPIAADQTEAHGLLHRLDIQTSGILLCAKTYVGAYWLRLQWCSYAVDKEYLCLVHGWVDRDVREIHKRIRIEKKKAPNSRRTISTHCTVSDSGKPSYTELVTLAHLKAMPAESDGGETEKRYSLVVLKLHTGRTHQIRVHMKSIGHPLVCDIKYAEELFPSDRMWCPRNFLHTYHLGFEDVPKDEVESSSSATANSVDIYCPLPQDLLDVLAGLTPADEESKAPLAALLTGKSGDMRSFEHYYSECYGDAQPGGSEGCR